jgi:hypothetical protein
MISKVSIPILVTGGVLAVAFLTGCEERAHTAVVMPADTVVVNIVNANGSISPVVLRHQGTVWVGPHGEQYLSMPTAEQLRPLYGIYMSAPVAAAPPPPAPVQPVPQAAAPVPPQAVAPMPQPAPQVVVAQPAPVVVAAPPAPVVVVPAPVYVPEYYVWDGYEYVGWCGGTYVYYGPHGWLVCDAIVLGRFNGWVRYHPDWRRDAVRYHDHDFDHGHDFGHGPHH